MRDRRRYENSKHASRATLLFEFYISLPSSLSLRTRSNSFASIHLLIFGSLFLVGQRLGGWVLSKRLANKSAWSSASEVLLHVFSDNI